MLGQASGAFTIRLRDFLATGTIRRRREAKVRERASDRGRLGVLETCDSVHVAIANALGRETSCRWPNLRERAKHIRLHRDLSLGLRDEPSEDATGGVARVVQRDSICDRG